MMCEATRLDGGVTVGRIVDVGTRHGVDAVDLYDGNVFGWHPQDAVVRVWHPADQRRSG